MIHIPNQFGRPATDEQAARYETLAKCLAAGINTNEAICRATGMKTTTVKKDLWVMGQAGLVHRTGPGGKPSTYTLIKAAPAHQPSATPSAKTEVRVKPMPCYSTASVGECRVSLPRAPWEAAE